MLSGENILLDARSFSVMALVLHELATNAAKYDALSVIGGRLEVDWRHCELTWRETDGPVVEPALHRGFGTVLIDRSVSYDLGGTTAVDYPAGGVIARFTIPAINISRQSPDTASAIETRAKLPSTGAGSLTLATVLLVEDQMLIALDVEAMLTALGVMHVVTCGSSADALARLKEFTPDVAILDVNLGAGNSMPVAVELRRRKIPFMFATGYGDGTMIPPAFAGVHVVRKPYDQNALLDGLSRYRLAAAALP